MEEKSSWKGLKRWSEVVVQALWRFKEVLSLNSLGLVNIKIKSKGAQFHLIPNALA